MNRAALYALFFLSGASGLVYEVVWVRQIGNELGNTVQSASLVSAVFLCGLGAGSYLAGGWADRPSSTGRRLLAAYGAFELVIGAWALALAWVLPRLGSVSAALSSYTQEASGWHALDARSYLLRQVLAVLLLVPITTLMGGTLSLLVRAVVAGDVALAGGRIGALYGANTLGAAAGCILTDTALVPALGYLHTQLLAAALSGVVGTLALLASRLRAPTPRPEATDAPAAAVAPKGGAPAAAVVPKGDVRALASGVLLTAAGVFLAGVAALGFEIVWFRVLVGVLGGYRPVFSILLTVVLVGIGAGSFLGGMLARRTGRPLESFLVAEALFVAACVASLALFDRGIVTPSAPGRLFGAYAREVWPIVTVVLLPSVLMGVSFPLANAIVQRAETAVGRRAGALYLASTLGNVAGSILAGFVLLPWVGSQASVTFFALSAACALIPLRAAAKAFGAPPTRALDRCLWAAGAISAGSVVGWAALPPGHLLARFLPPPPRAPHVLTTREGIFDVVVVSEDASGARLLSTDGHPMSANSIDAQRYMRAFAHVPLLGMDRPERALVICFGVGNTLHAVSLHPSVTQIEVADLSANVLRHAAYFAATNHDVLRDPRVRVFVNDGRQHLRMAARESYDLITLEPPPIAFAGVASLYSREFYELARGRLRAGGALTQWLPIYQVPRETALEIVRAFVDVFPGAVLLSGERAELILMGTKGKDAELDLTTVARNLAARPAVVEDLQRVYLGTTTELAGMFVADAEVMRTATAASAPVTDDRPSMEYGEFDRSLTRILPRELFHPERVATYCPGCLSDAAPEAAAELRRYLAALGDLYGSKGFLLDARPTRLPGVQRHAEAIQASRYLQVLFGSQLAESRARPTPRP